MLRTRLLTLLSLIAFSVGTSAAEGLAAQVKRCQQIGSDTGRLSCYDALLPQPPAEPGETPIAAPAPPAPATLPAAPPPATVAAPPPTAAPVASAPPFPKRATIDAMIKTIDNRKVFYLDDGSIWRETRASRNNYKPGTKVTVEQSGVLGQDTWKRYRMEIDGRSFSVMEITPED